MFIIVGQEKMQNAVLWALLILFGGRVIPYSPHTMQFSLREAITNNFPFKLWKCTHSVAAEDTREKERETNAFLKRDRKLGIKLGPAKRPRVGGSELRKEVGQDCLRLWKRYLCRNTERFDPKVESPISVFLSAVSSRAKLRSALSLSGVLGSEDDLGAKSTYLTKETS